MRIVLTGFRSNCCNVTISYNENIKDVIDCVNIKGVI